MNHKLVHRTFLVYLVSFLIVLPTLVLARINLGEINPTNEWVDFYGMDTTLNGEPVPVGAKVTAKDPDGVTCGSYTVGTEGQYGLMHVYKDDAMTPSIDEGADPGDTITFYINGNLATVVSGNPTWTANGDQKQVELSINLENEGQTGNTDVKPILSSSSNNENINVKQTEKEEDVNQKNETTQKKELGVKEDEQVTNTSRNPKKVVGVLISILIVVCGLIIFILITKSKKL